MAKPLVIDLFCGLGGWTRAFLDEGWDTIGFDIERHDYGTGGYPGRLVLQDVLTLDGRQFRGRAALIVASPPCQEFSYMAMPWSRGKQIAAALRGEVDFPENYQGSRTISELCALFNACFRIAAEAGTPLVVENVKGAQPWVGPARANFGSFFFWGDIEQVGNRIMRSGPVQFGQATLATPSRVRLKARVVDCSPQMWKDRDGDFRTGRKGPGGDWFENGRQGQDACAEGLKVPGFRFDGSGKSFPVGKREWNEEQRPQLEWLWRARLQTPRFQCDKYTAVSRTRLAGGKVGGDWFGSYAEQKAAGTISPGRLYGKNSDSRKAASAMIAMIPYPIAQHIARVFKP